MHPLTGKYVIPLQPIDVANVETDNESDFDENIVLPSSTRRPTGRPMKRRIRSASENNENAAPRRINRCGRCTQIGHTRRMCREDI